MEHVKKYNVHLTLWEKDVPIDENGVEMDDDLQFDLLEEEAVVGLKDEYDDMDEAYQAFGSLCKYRDSEDQQIAETELNVSILQPTQKDIFNAGMAYVLFLEGDIDEGIHCILPTCDCCNENPENIFFEEFFKDRDFGQAARNFYEDDNVGKEIAEELKNWLKEKGVQL